MRKKITLGTAIGLMFMAMTLTFCVTMLLSTRIFESRVESVSEKESMYDKISDIDSAVKQNFYTTVDSDKILDALSAGYINGLGDSESKYLTADQVIDYQRILRGKIIGVGVEFSKSREKGGYMLISKVYAESPADVRGMEVGDLITAIGGTSTANMSLDSAREMLSGEVGDSVDLTYMRETTETTISLTHRVFDLPEISYSKESDSGYIRISTFNAGTASALEYAVNNLISQDVTSLIIDLRDNSSNDFDSAARAADILIPEGTTMYAVYQTGDKKVLYTSDKTSCSLPIVVITNGGTGYAAEMFAVMMKDSMGGKTVGSATMGKGTIQKLYRLPDGSGIIITVASLSPLTSAPYNGAGILPDYEKQLDSSIDINMIPVAEDPQIQRALEVAANLAGKTDALPEGGQPAEGEAENGENSEDSSDSTEDSSSNSEENSDSGEENSGSEE